MSILTKSTYWISTGERALSTAAQAGVAAIGTDVVGVLDLDGVAVASLMGGAAVLSVLKSLAAIPITGSASLAGTEHVNPTKRELAENKQRSHGDA